MRYTSRPQPEESNSESTVEKSGLLTVSPKRRATRSLKGILNFALDCVEAEVEAAVEAEAVVGIDARLALGWEADARGSGEEAGVYMDGLWSLAGDESGSPEGARGVKGWLSSDERE